MTITAVKQTSILNTERGLTIEGTRITLYDVMDYAQYPPQFVRGLFDLTEEQMSAALTYIETNREVVEAEYLQVLRESDELQRYYAVQNGQRMTQISSRSPKPGTEKAWEKLQLAKAKRESQA